jgi:hypothetical protein
MQNAKHSNCLTTDPSTLLRTSYTDFTDSNSSRKEAKPQRKRFFTGSVIKSKIKEQKAK